MEGTASDKARQLVNEKMAASKDGTIYLNDADMRTMIEAVREKNAGRTVVNTFWGFRVLHGGRQCAPNPGYKAEN